jgi:hypothetical protein
VTGTETGGAGFDQQAAVRRPNCWPTRRDSLASNS